MLRHISLCGVASPRRSLALLDSQPAVDCMLVHISEYCHELTATGHPSSATRAAADTAMSSAPASYTDAARGRMDGTAASAQQSHARTGKDATGLLSYDLIDAASAQQLAHRAFGELAATAAAAAARGIHFRRCQPLMMHLTTVSGAGHTRLRYKTHVCTCRTHRLHVACMFAACACFRQQQLLRLLCYCWLRQIKVGCGVPSATQVDLAQIPYAAIYDCSRGNVTPVCMAALFFDAFQFVDQVMFSRWYPDSTAEEATEAQILSGTSKDGWEAARVAHMRDWAHERICEGHPMHAALDFAISKAAEDALEACQSSTDNLDDQTPHT